MQPKISEGRPFWAKGSTPSVERVDPFDFEGRTGSQWPSIISPLWGERYFTNFKVQNHANNLPNEAGWTIFQKARFEPFGQKVRTIWPKGSNLAVLGAKPPLHVCRLFDLYALAEFLHNLVIHTHNQSAMREELERLYISIATTRTFVSLKKKFLICYIFWGLNLVHSDKIRIFAL